MVLKRQLTHSMFQGNTRKESDKKSNGLIPESRRPKRARKMITNLDTTSFVRNTRKEYLRTGKRRINPLSGEYRNKRYRLESPPFSLNRRNPESKRAKRRKT